MRRLIVVLALTIPTAPWILAADETPWPQKGDTIYIAAKLEGFNTPMVMVGCRHEETRRPNAAFRFRRSSARIAGASTPSSDRLL